jgi:hypothetical protein
MRLAAVVLACLMFFSTGCCMCAAPYDYCAPTYTGRCGEDCRPHARVNSAFSGYGPGGGEPTLAVDEGQIEMQDGAELPPRAGLPEPMPETYSALRRPSK